MVLGEFGDDFADGEEEEVRAFVVEVALVAILFDEGESGDEDGVVELDEGLAIEESIGDGAGFVLVHGRGGARRRGLRRRARRRCRAGCGGRTSGERGGPSRTMQTVSGVERMRPGHPQRSAQKMAMARRAREEMPVRGAVEPGFDEVGSGEFEREEEGEDENGRPPGGGDGDRDDEGEGRGWWAVPT